MTKEQEQSIDKYYKLGYTYDMKLSVSFCAVVIAKGDMICIYGLGGEIDVERKMSDFNVIHV